MCDIVAQADDDVDLAPFEVARDGGQRRPVAVDISERGEPHALHPRGRRDDQDADRGGSDQEVQPTASPDGRSGGRGGPDPSPGAITGEPALLHWSAGYRIG